MRAISPITKREFLNMFRKCLPPKHAGKKIAVANSGGPDSTCLLFLIHRCLADETKGLPSSVVSLTVDHALQVSSSAMAEHCAKTAASLGIDHTTTPIPWSEPPFPPRPADGESLERIARDARFHLLFHAMTRVGATMLALGHHADDQVETSLMRLGRNTSELGAGGMRRCRRWGMGLKTGEESLGWAGYEGMNRWILRPLLDVGKDRILATCEENGLTYVNDPTNFQPEVTLRNAIRQMLNQQEKGSEALPSSIQTSMPPEIAEKLAAIKSATQSLRSVDIDISGGREQLRGAVKFLTSRVEDVDSQVDSHLHRRTIMSPIGTFLLSDHNLSSIIDPTVRIAMVLRIMRYVSFHPWGSIRADANRRGASLQQIVSKIWDPNPLEGARTFVAGGGVLWTPVVVEPDGRIKILDRAKKHVLKPEQRRGWLASRQPPLRGEKLGRMGTHNPLQLDLTDQLAKCNINDTKKTLEILYDCRFLFRFNVDMMPEDIEGWIMGPGRDGEISVQPQSRWYWPKVIWQRPGRTDEELGSIAGDTNQQDEYWNPKTVKQTTQAWIDIEWIRSIDAV